MSSIEQRRGDSFLFYFPVLVQRTQLPQTLLAPETKMWFTVKSRDADADAAAVVQLFAEVDALGVVVGDNAYTGTAQGGAAASVTLAETASADDDFYRGLLLTVTGGTGAGQERRIESYDGETKIAVVSAAWVTPPDETSTYSIHYGSITVLPAPDDHNAVVELEPGVTARLALGDYRADLQVELPGPPVRVFTPWKDDVVVVPDTTRALPT